MFPELAPHDASAGTLMHYGDAGGPLEARNDLDSSLDEDNPRIPAGWPFFGNVGHIWRVRSPCSTWYGVISPQCRSG